MYPCTNFHSVHTYVKSVLFLVVLYNIDYTYNQGQNVAATGAIAGYFEVFATCKLLEKSEKMDH